MVQMTSVLAAAILAGSAVAHPGHSVVKEAINRRDFIHSKPRSVSACSEHLKARGHTDRAIERRAALANDLRNKRTLKRDTADVLATDHHSNLTGITTETDAATLFADDSSCVLQPDVTEGPYFVTGELVREDVREDEVGVAQYAYLQIIDTSTCEPLENVYVDFWHCNSTGVYGGIAADGNGDASDASNINTTAYRGVQLTDSDGIATFITNVPGHYSGRANHIHIMTHAADSVTVYENGTLGTNAIAASHVGQLYYDQDLLTEVESYSPYTQNTQNWTMNTDDFILAQEADYEDPLFNYVLLGDSLSDGILSWVRIGIDSTASYNVSNAAYVDESGGHATGNTISLGFKKE